MIKRTDLEKYLNELLACHGIQDYCPNGLQVEGRSEIKKIVTGVSACQALLDAAVREHADAVLVHHGYFWKGEESCVTGLRKKRLQTLLTHDINLFAYHLPLDLHPELGNNVQLAELLGLQVLDHFAINGLKLGCLGQLKASLSGQAFADLLNTKLGRQPFYIPGKAETLKTIAWCTGAAQDAIDAAVMAGADAYLTGEVSERTVHIAREYGIHFYAAGHHATERYGIQALGKHLVKQFNLTHHYIEIDNSV